VRRRAFIRVNMEGAMRPVFEGWGCLHCRPSFEYSVFSPLTQVESEGMAE
jgi:hypothetical protein